MGVGFNPVVQQNQWRAFWRRSGTESSRQLGGAIEDARGALSTPDVLPDGLPVYYTDRQTGELTSEPKQTSLLGFVAQKVWQWLRGEPVGISSQGANSEMTGAGPNISGEER